MIYFVNLHFNFEDEDKTVLTSKIVNQNRKSKYKMDFIYQDPYPILKDDTVYKKLTSDYVKVEQLGDREILTIDPKGLELLAEKKQWKMFLLCFVLSIWQVYINYR